MDAVMGQPALPLSRSPCNLKKIATPEVTTFEIADWAISSSDSCTGYVVPVTGESIAFPNAKGLLREELWYSVPLAEVYTSGGYGGSVARTRTWEDIERDRLKIMAHDPHKTRNAAIA
jgi:hypothetical protein